MYCFGINYEVKLNEANLTKEGGLLTSREHFGAHLASTESCVEKYQKPKKIYLKKTSNETKERNPTFFSPRDRKVSLFVQ